MLVREVRGISEPYSILMGFKGFGPRITRIALIRMIYINESIGIWDTHLLQGKDLKSDNAIK